MKFENKIRVTKENKVELENIIGDILFEGQIVYLEPSDFEFMNEVKNRDLLSYLYQETGNHILIWDSQFGLNVTANCFGFAPEQIKELETSLESCFIGNYGDNN